MATGFEWTKLGLDNVKVVLPILIVLASTAGFTINDNLDKNSVIKEQEKEAIESQEQMSNIAEHFYITTKPIKPQAKSVKVQCTSACIKIINDAVTKGINKHATGRKH